MKQRPIIVLQPHAEVPAFHNTVLDAAAKWLSNPCRSGQRNFLRVDTTSFSTNTQNGHSTKNENAQRSSNLIYTTLATLASREITGLSVLERLWQEQDAVRARQGNSSSLRHQVALGPGSQKAKTLQILADTVAIRSSIGDFGLSIMKCIVS